MRCRHSTAHTSNVPVMPAQSWALLDRSSSRHVATASKACGEVSILGNFQQQTNHYTSADDSRILPTQLLRCRSVPRFMLDLVHQSKREARSLKPRQAERQVYRGPLSATGRAAPRNNHVSRSEASTSSHPIDSNAAQVCTNSHHGSYTRSLLRPHLLPRHRQCAQHPDASTLPRVLSRVAAQG